jgi:hypothetical protein
MEIRGLALVAMGIFTVVAAGMDWDWFMNHRKARLFVSLFGRTGTRVFYGLLGSVLITLGGMLTFGGLPN